MSIPTKVSNGRLIRQLELWGYTKGKVKGDRVVYNPPNPLLGPVTVMQAHVHKGNSTEALRAVYSTVTEGNAVLFWARNAPANVPVDEAVDSTIERAVAIVKEANRIVDEHHQARTWVEQNDSQPTIVIVPDEPTPQPTQEDPMPQPATSRKVQRGATQQVLQYMHDHPHDTVTAGLIARRTDMDKHTVGGALAHLCNLGHVERLVRGTYRLTAGLAADKTVRHTGSVEVPKAALAKQSGATVTPITPTMVAPHTPEHVHPVVPDTGDDLDALLELVLPVGYEFKPAHLRAMRKWQAATAELLAVLRGQ